MVVKFDAAGVKGTEAWEYLLRFFFGGAITAAAGLIGERFGPAIAGLFLAFPAIVTLIARHERERKAKKGLLGKDRAITAAANYAMGTALGCLGLMAFAAICWKYIGSLPAAITLGAGTLVWAVIVSLAWFAIKRWH